MTKCFLNILTMCFLQSLTVCLLQILAMCNSSVAIRQASPYMAMAALTACVRQLESLTPDQLSQAVFLSAQTSLRLNAKVPDTFQQLVHVGIARAAAMTPFSLSRFMFGAAAVRGLIQI